MASFWDVASNTGMNGGQSGPNNGQGIFGTPFGNIPNASEFGGMISGTLSKLGDQVTGKAYAPQYTNPTMDAASQAQVSDQMNGLLAKGPQDYTNQMMQGTGAAGNIQNQTGNMQNEQNQFGGGGINGMTQAIGQKAQKNFSQEQGQLQQKSKLQGQEMANKNMLSAQSMGVALSDAQNHVNTKLNNLQLQQNAATYATVAGLMSGAGKIGGAYYGSHSSSPPLSSSQYNSQYGQGTSDVAPGDTSSVYNTDPNTGQNTGYNGGPGSTYNNYGDIFQQ